MIALGDLQLPGSVGLHIISPSWTMTMGKLSTVIPQRHSDGANMAFADGRVEGAKQSLWIEKTSEARSRWNNDHQPHPEFW